MQVSPAWKSPPHIAQKPKLKRLVFSCSRSANPRYPEVHRLDDTTRYNSAMCNVMRYQDFPNRSGTPIKSPRASLPASTSRSTPSLKTLKSSYIKSLVSTQPLLSPSMKQRLEGLALSPTARLSTAGPTVRAIGSRYRCGDVVNDYHMRETNPGFARNELGGFFMR